MGFERQLPIVDRTVTPVTVAEGAALIKKTEGATRMLIARRQIPHRRRGRTVYLIKEELLMWLDQQDGLRLEELQTAR